MKSDEDRVLLRKHSSVDPLLQKVIKPIRLDLFSIWKTFSWTLGNFWLVIFSDTASQKTGWIFDSYQIGVMSISHSERNGLCLNYGILLLFLECMISQLVNVKLCFCFGYKKLMKLKLGCFSRPIQSEYLHFVSLFGDFPLLSPALNEYYRLWIINKLNFIVCCL